MRFSIPAVSAALAIASPHAASAFVSPMSSTVAFTKKNVSLNMMPLSWTNSKTCGSSCRCSACVSISHSSSSCRCPVCVATRRSMSAVEEAVPEEVAVLDGVLSEDEAHNIDRPVRDSGLAKHKKDNKKERLPIADLKKGTVLTGKVKTLTSYGAFLDVGYAVDALLHVSRMSDSFTSSPDEVVTAGQEYEVRVVNVDLQKNQIAVSMRSEEAESKPASQQQQQRGGGRDRAPSSGSGYMLKLAEKGFDSSVFIEGDVVNTLDWGAFVKVNLSPFLAEAEGGDQKDMFAEGLVHISCMGKGRVDSVSSVLKVGDKIQVRVKGVDGTKLSLSMISEEDENSSGGGRSSSNKAERGENSAPWSTKGSKASSDEWKATLLELQEAMPKFKNPPIVYKARK